METLASRALDDWGHFKKTYVSPAVLNGHWDLVIDDLFSGCYGFQIFNKAFCEQFIEEAEKHGGWGGILGDAVPGPDLLLENFGFNDFYDKVLRDFVHPAIIHKYHLEEVMEETLDEERFQTKNFVIKYTLETQSHLSPHHDFSGVTTLLTLNDNYEGGGTWFPDHKKIMKGTPGYISMHPGMFTHYHGARPVLEGSRYVVINFNNW
jgi:hypothetical protein